MAQSAPTICLNMIVRDEAPVIGEVLDAVAPFITTWVIVDTGSLDGTQHVIKERMEMLGVAGELHERRWRNFGRNRTEALRLAQGKADFIWTLGADDLVEGELDRHALTADCVSLLTAFDDGTRYWRRQLFRGDALWRFHGFVDERVEFDEPFTDRRVEGDCIVRRLARPAHPRRPSKYLRARDQARAVLEQDPSDPQAALCLARCSEAMGDLDAALHWFRRRTEMTSGDEENYLARFGIAAVLDRMGAPWSEVMTAYLQAWEARPTRAEPLYEVARRCRVRGEYNLGYVFAGEAELLPVPSHDELFVRADVYSWRVLDELAVCASWIGKGDEAGLLWGDILDDSGRELPADDLARIRDNHARFAPGHR